MFCTTGILLRRLLLDRVLKGVSHVIVDEIHEQGMNEDFLLIILKDLLACQPDLRLILMSATLNAELFSSYFGGARMIHIPEFIMRKRIAYLLLVCLLIHTALARKGGKGHHKALPVSKKKWLTLKGTEPVVGAHGGLSGVFPEGSEISYIVAGSLSLPNTQMYCNVHFMSDGHGICPSDIRLMNFTSIAEVFPNGRKTYNINGNEVQGWFALDYTFDTKMANVLLIRNMHTRPSIFDGAFGLSDPFSLYGGDTLQCLDKCGACLSQNENGSKKSNTLIISHLGASGDFPSSTELAYQKAIDDGGDIIDCAVQLSKDGVAFCSGSADLTGSTTALATEIQEMTGIFSFDLTWTEIQSLKPQLRSPFDKELNRNPINMDKGKILTLREFLELFKKRNVGVLIDIENVPYLAAEKGLDMIKAVTKALTDAGLDKQTKQKVMIQSDDTFVLKQFNQVPSYQRVLDIKRDLGGVLADVATEIKKYTDAVTVQRNAIVLSYPDLVFLSKNFSNMIPAMHAANISVYAGVFRNEFQNFLFHYFSDPCVELATFVNAKINGVITEFPFTAAAYMSSPCVDVDDKDLPYVILPVKPGDFYSQDPHAIGFAMVPSPEPFISADAPLPPVTITSLAPANPPALSEDKPSQAPIPKRSAAADMLIANSAAVFDFSNSWSALFA